ncbi:MAG: M23 family metallopeptidase [Terrimicrobiaceae bacterium]|nr:M23 family metallopeptidase [Terrimicrobiaceae bacterium]
MRKRLFWLALALCVGGLVAAPQPRTARTRLADGFDQPVGKPDAEGYYMSRGFRANYHMGEDWNGLGGGNSDLGDPVYSTAHGFVVMARDVRMGWGNLVIIRHAFLENGRLQFVDSVYAHLQRITVREGQQVTRGQQVGTIGSNRGMYTAHLHFEVRKNLNIGFNQRGFPRDLSAYYVPGRFIEPRRKLPGGGRSALVPVGTFQAPRSSGPAFPTGAKELDSQSPQPTPRPKIPFRVNRFDDL